MHHYEFYSDWNTTFEWKIKYLFLLLANLQENTFDMIVIKTVVNIIGCLSVNEKLKGKLESKSLFMLNMIDFIT